MVEDHKKKMKELMSQIKCEHNFICYFTPMGDICKARDIGVDGFLTCMDNYSDFCIHSLDFGDSRFCTCPVNNYIIKNGIKYMKCKSFFCRLMDFTERI